MDRFKEALDALSVDTHLMDSRTYRVLPTIREALQIAQRVQAQPDTVTIKREVVEKVRAILNQSEYWIGDELFDDDDRAKGSTQEERAEFISERWKEALALLDNAMKGNE